MRSGSRYGQNGFQKTHFEHFGDLGPHMSKKGVTRLILGLQALGYEAFGPKLKALSNSLSLHAPTPADLRPKGTREKFAGPPGATKYGPLELP